MQCSRDSKEGEKLREGKRKEVANPFPFSWKFLAKPKVKLSPQKPERERNRQKK